MTQHPAHLVVGPPRHGVVSFALALAEALERRNYPAPIVRVDRWTELDHSGGLHVNFTDRLFGSTPGEAARRVSVLARHVRSGGTRVTATLHDVPQPADGGNYRDRVDAYRAVCGALHGCATNSEHERSLLAESGIADPRDVVVIPLPLEIGAAPVARPSVDRRSVAVLGFVYPGKGHGEVLAAMADIPGDADFAAIGECSAGHEDLAVDLAEAARCAGRRFTVTGFVPQQSLSSVLQRVGVPVIHHRHVSASGSLNTWISARRRPLTPVNRYTVEHERRHPGTVHLYPDTHRGLVDALQSALDNPASTWLDGNVRSGAPTSEVARQYAETLERWHD